MADCICGKQSPEDFLHVMRQGCRAHDNTVDPWHYTGNTAWHNNLKSNEFLSFCRDKLPKGTLPIWVGNTGYVNACKDIFNLSNGWCYDELGRTVILLDGLLMFQRYQKGDLIMGSKDGKMFDCVTSDRFQEFMSRVEKKRESNVTHIEFPHY